MPVYASRRESFIQDYSYIIDDLVLTDRHVNCPLLHLALDPLYMFLFSRSGS